MKYQFSFLLSFLALSCFSQSDEFVTSERSFDRSLLASLEDRIADETFKQITSVVVLYEGQLLYEQYFNGADQSTKHDPRSATKTIASAVTGIALEEGYLQSTEQTLDEFYTLSDYQNPSPLKEKVSLQNLLTMSSGFDGFDFEPESIGNEENMYPQDNWVEWTLNLPMAGRDPGSEWAYFTAGVGLLGDILDQQVPGGLEAYTERTLFGPLGIEDYRWQQTPQGVGNTAGGLGMRARDLAKFGQLYQNGGRWQGQQVLPQSWVNESLQKHFVLPFDGLSYGYLFWHKSYQVEEKTYPVFACSGNGGNKVFVFTEIPVVVVVTARAYNQSYMHRQVDEMMDQYILPAILKE